MVVDFVEKETGFELDICVTCYGREQDMIVEWELHEGDKEYEELLDAFFESQSNIDNPLVLAPYEIYKNRGNIFQRMFKSDNLSYCYNRDNATYSIYVNR